MATSSIFTDIILDDEKEVKRLLKAVKQSKRYNRKMKLRESIKRYYSKMSFWGKLYFLRKKYGKQTKFYEALTIAKAWELFSSKRGK